MLKENHLQTIKATVFCIILVALILLPGFLWDKQILTSDSDAFYYYLPVFEFYSDALKSGESFLWNPYIFSGFPTYLSQSAGFFDPVNMVIFKFFNTFDAYNLRLGLGLFLTLLFSYFAGKKFGLSTLASSLIGVSYLLAFHWRFLSNLIISNTLFLLPFLFFIYKSYLESTHKKWKWLLWGGVGVGWAFISGYAQLVIYSVVLIGMYALIHYWFSAEKRDIKGVASKVLVPILVIVVIGFVVGLPQIIPALKFSDLTIRNEAIDYNSATIKSVMPGDLSLFLFPDYSYFPYVTSGRKPLYVGALWFLLAIVATLILIKNKFNLISQNKEIVIIFLLFLFAFLASLKWSPIFYLLSKLPVFELFRFPFRWMFLGSWFLAVLGAFGLDMISEYKSDQVIKFFFKIYVVIFSLFSLVIVLLNLVGSSFISKATALIDNVFSKFVYGHFGLLKDPGHYYQAIENGLFAWRQFTSLSTPTFLVPFLVIVTSSLIVYLFLWEKISKDKFRIYVFITTVVTFLSIFSVHWQLSVDEELFYSQNDIVKNLQIENPSFRSYPFLLNASLGDVLTSKYKLSDEELLAVTEFQLASARPNMNIFSGINSIDGYDVFLTNDMKDALTVLGSDNGAQDENRGKSVEDIKQLFLDRLDVLSMMSGKYVLSGVVLVDKNLKLLDTVNVSDLNIPIYIYENSLAVSKYRFGNNIVFTNKTFKEISSNSGNNFLSNTFVECMYDCSQGSKSKTDTITLVSEGNGKISLITETNDERWLVINESYLLGWQAYTDGDSVDIHKVNGLYLGLLVPPGKHRVDLKYKGIIGEDRFLKYLGLGQ